MEGMGPIMRQYERPPILFITYRLTGRDKFYTGFDRKNLCHESRAQNGGFETPLINANSYKKVSKSA